MKEHPYFNPALLPLAVLRQVCLWSDWAAEQAGLATDGSLLPEQILIGCQCQTSSPAHFPSQPGAAPPAHVTHPMAHEIHVSAKLRTLTSSK